MHVTMISRYKRGDQEEKRGVTKTKTSMSASNGAVIKYIRDKSKYVMQCIFTRVANKDE